MAWRSPISLNKELQIRYTQIIKVKGEVHTSPFTFIAFTIRNIHQQYPTIL